MANLAINRQDEVLITRGDTSEADARAIQRQAKAGKFARIAEGVYLRDSETNAQAAIIRRNWSRILAALVPGAVISYRSAYAGGLTTDGVIYLSHPTRFNRTIQMP